jgi:hypothetical protein
VRKFYYLISLLVIACQQPDSSPAAGIPAKLVSGNKQQSTSFTRVSAVESSDSGVFELNGFRVTVTNTLPMQNINVSLKGKRLINYLHAIDSLATSIPVPTLITSDKDTVVAVTYQEQRYLFSIKNNKAALFKE